MQTDAKKLRQYVIDHIDEAVEKGYIRVFYQPVVRTLTSEVCGMEALSRWVDPDYGFLTPDRFIPPLEESGQIHKLDACMVRTICREYAERTKNGIPNVTLSFNLSRLDFGLCDIHAIIEQAVEDNLLPRDAFRVEITESTMEQDAGKMHQVIDRFWERGFRVWMDDFGSGYSSLNVLKDYRFDTLKIDMVFLQSFDPRSREIIKSVVDMSKRIGVHTLAEGVETKEQLEFLRKIGCEKAQGYFIGKPMPYEDCLKHVMEEGYSLESQVKRQYFHEIGKVNLLSATPFVSLKDNEINPEGRDAQLPMAFVELSDHRIHYLFANENYMRVLHTLNIPDTRMIEEEYGEGDTAFGEKFLAQMRKASLSKKVESVNFVRRGMHCFAQVRCIADYPGGSAYLCVLQNLSENAQIIKSKQLTEYADSLFALYDLIELVDLNTGYSSSIYQSRQTKGNYNRLPVVEELKHYAEAEIYPDDREAYLEFHDLSTVEERLQHTTSGFISSPFRTLLADGNYDWKLYILLNTGHDGERKLLSCSRRIIAGNVIRINKENTAKNVSSAFSLELLWHNLEMSSEIPFFWKDMNHKYVGANHAFLSYFGLETADELTGKTSEEMGYTIEPGHHQLAEKKALDRGEKTIRIPGTCIRKGELRNILTTRLPLYDDNGRIIGLLGYFVDITDQHFSNMRLSHLSIHDPVTGLPGFLGIIESALHYQESYALNSQNFTLIFLDIVGFRNFNQTYGIEWGNELLRQTADRIREIIGSTGVVGRYAGDYFLILRQCSCMEEAEELANVLREKVQGIYEVERIPCTIYCRIGCCLFTETKNVQEMYVKAHDRAKAEE